METNELVNQLDLQMEFLSEARETGSEAKVLYRIGVIRGMLDQAHAERLEADKKLEDTLQPPTVS